MWRILVATMLAAHVAAPGASAQIGEMDLRQCFSADLRAGCDAGRTVQPAIDLAVSPDGTRAYALGGSGIASYRRDPETQAMTYLSCVGSSQDVPCESWPQQGSFAPTYLEVSPQGDHVYAYGNGIYVFEVTEAGLQFASCSHWSASLGPGCAIEPKLDNVIDGAIAPDGATVYVTTATSDRSVWRLLTLTRSPADGGVTLNSCISQQSAEGCSPVTANGALREPADIEISGDGRSLYVASGDSLDAFTRDPGTGVLAFAACFGHQNPAAVGCSPDSMLVKGLRYLALSPDGRHLYASDPEGPGLISYDRDTTTGTLSGLDCSLHHSCGFDDQRWSALAKILISPDGNRLYSVENPPHRPTLLVLNRERTHGMLSIRGCWSADDYNVHYGCNRESRLHGVRGLAVSPDGFSVLTSSRANGLSLLGWRVLNLPDCRDVLVTGTSGLAVDLRLPCTSVVGHPVTSAQVVTQPAHGTAVTTADPLKLSYTATSGYTGPDELEYRVANDMGGTDTKTLRILVGPASGAPLCAGATRTTAHGAPVTVPLTCAAPPGQTTTLRIGTPPSGGTLGAISASGTVTYTPDPGFEGADEFTYIGRGSTDEDSAPALVRITVSAPPRALAAESLTACVGAGDVLLLRDDCGGMASIAWNGAVPGGPGPAGEPGRDAEGPAGPPGPAGTFRWPAVRTVVTSWAITEGKPITRRANCGPDEAVIGGAVSGPYQYHGPTYSPPFGPNGPGPVEQRGAGVVYTSRPALDFSGWIGRADGRGQIYIVAYCLRAR